MKKPSFCKYCAHRKECNTSYLESLKDGIKQKKIVMHTKVAVLLALLATGLNVHACIVCFLVDSTGLALINIICIIVNLCNIRRLLK